MNDFPALVFFALPFKILFTAEFVPYELAVKLKELGFDEPCFGYYVDGELRGVNLGIEELGGVEPYYQRLGFHTLNNHDIFNTNKIVVTAPTFSQAFRWLMQFPQIKKYRYNIALYSDGTYSLKDGKDAIYEYLSGEDCVDKLIEIVEKK